MVVSMVLQTNTMTHFLFPHKRIIFPSKFAMCHVHIHRDHLYPVWKAHPGTWKDEIGALYGRSSRPCKLHGNVVRDHHLAFDNWLTFTIGIHIVPEPV